MKRIITLLLMLVLLTSCGTPKGNLQGVTGNVTDQETATEGAPYYLNLLYNYEVKDKNSENTKDNEEFEEYLNQVFKDTLTIDYCYMHSNISDYRALGIEKPEVTWGEVSYNIDEDYKKYVGELEALKAFDYDSLSYREQYYYDMYEYSLLETITDLFYERYTTLFSKGTNVLSSIVINLDEFKITDKEYLDDYMVLLADTDRYLSDLLAYTEDQMKDGIYHSDESIDFSVDYAMSFVSKSDDNALITSFNNKIEEMDFLTDSEKETYKSENRTIILSEVIPAYETAIEKLNSYRGKLSSDEARLCDIDLGYAKTTYLLRTSSNKNIDELFQDGLDVMVDILIDFINALEDESAIDEYYTIYESDNYGAFGLSDEETLKYLEDKFEDKFPTMDQLNYTVSRLDASSASGSTVAYYVDPQLDDLDKNVIRTNPNLMGDDVIDDYVTLAHEGIPGHMYQYAYYRSTNPNRFTSTQQFIGYTEGYACYAMLEALECSGIQNENTLKIIKFFQIYFYLLDSLCDIGINVYGWDKDKIDEFLSEYYPYEYESSYVDDIYTSCITRPGTLTSYGIGYVEFALLRSMAEEALGNNFNLKEYHKVLLDEGPLPFAILEDKVNDYISEKK